MNVKIGGVNFDKVTMENTLGFISKVLAGKNSVFITTVNVDILVRCNKNPGFRNIINDSDLVLADGMPIVWLSKLLKNKLPERVTGADLTKMLCKHSAENSTKIYFLGSKEGIAKLAKENAEKLFPGVNIVGYYSPSHDEILDSHKSKKIVDIINKTKADILLVAFGSPKQETWIYNNKSLLETKINIGVGASIDFLSGTVKRSPEFLQKLGLEWFYRLLKEPKRMFRRYIIQDAYFLKIIVKDWLETKKERKINS